ncbi:hypothetical protein J5X98_14165 [Leptothermofonsia sichuanensis E412]|uniref:hypothetical protein n=1 Tax=Leptothermofonsia sichuanensis TaxID=2917832 RepID=UPI001CA64E46|nr:hypothetical protein [Leptothermofonsia sichuanensis]QZZ18631.1 hypothetical protein J5X98_14165 [Leptothermofonsia sichuanensis E412]
MSRIHWLKFQEKSEVLGYLWRRVRPPISGVPRIHWLKFQEKSEVLGYRRYW